MTNGSKTLWQTIAWIIGGGLLVMIVGITLYVSATRYTAEENKRVMDTEIKPVISRHSDRITSLESDRTWLREAVQQNARTLGEVKGMVDLIGKAVVRMETLKEDGK